MGGCVTTRYLEQNQGVFDAAIFSSPMYKPSTDPFSYDFAYNVSKTNVNLGLGNTYALGQPWGASKGNFEDNPVTTSQPRWEAWNTARHENNDELDINGHTYDWVYQALKVSEETRAPENLRNITTPMRILQCENDLIVDTSVYAGVQNEINNAGGYCELITFDDLPEHEPSMHELFMEKDIVRDVVIDLVKEFIDRYTVQ